MTTPPRGFLDDPFEPRTPPLPDSRFVLSLVPYEETTTYRKGTAKAPEAIVDASGHIEVLDETLLIDASTQGVLTLRPAITDLASITAHARSVREQHPDALPGFLGGEHSITPALIEGVARDDMGVVWLDAHADMRHAFHGSPVNHACAAFNSMKFGPIVQVGVRSLAEEEYENFKKTDRVRMFREWADEAREAILALPENIYLSLDMDGFAPEVVRAVGTPEPGGLNWRDVMEILALLFEHKTVFAYDVVELCPNELDVASEYIAARVTYKIMSYHARHKLGLTPR